MSEISAPLWIDIQTVTMIVVKIIVILIPLILAVAYFTFAERKIIGYMQVRIGPNRVGPRGLLQPIADVVKLLFKEVIIPIRANRFLFFLAPILAIGPACVVKYCVNQKLSEVEKKVELLLKDKEGRLQLKLLDSLADDEEKNEGGD